MCAGIFYFRRGFDMLKESCFKIGYIQRTHGLKGELTVVLDSALPETALESVFVEESNRLVPYFLKNLSVQGSKGLISFEDVDDVDHARKLVGRALYLQKTLRPRLQRGEFYDDELVGCSVTDEVMGTLGTVTSVVEAGPNKLLALEYESREILIPLNGPFIKTVNKSKRTIAVALPEGFLEI